MTGSLHPLVDQLVEICAARGVHDWILAPGSRSAPLTVALTRHAAMRCRLIFDERAAAYVALGLAQQLRTPVGLVCTSGTAAVNFAPAVVEAFYQGVPLLVLTADRPPEWIDQQDNQAIHQNDLYAPHVRGGFSLPVDDGRPDTRWFVARIVANAIDLAQGWEPGPVHINVPLREPLYTPPQTAPAATTTASVTAPTRALASRPQLDEASWQELLEQWRGASRKLIVAGMHPGDTNLHAALAALAADPSAAIFADVTANLHTLPCVPAHADAILSTRDAATLDRLRPDLVVNFGGQVTSKNIKTLLRGRGPKALWHVRPNLIAPDTYQALTHTVPMAAADFFGQLAVRVGQSPEGCDAAYQAAWAALDREAAAVLEGMLAEAPFNEFAAAYQVLSALPEGSLLQAGNSMPIRYINLLGLQRGHYPAQVNGNRGTSGIDGTVSTTVGAAMAGPAITTLIVGDLGFFYDRNGLWHRHLPPNLRIVVLNNHGGGIFDIIEGPNQLERARQETYFLTPQPLTARRTAEDHGLRYFHATESSDLSAQLGEFFAENAGAALLEIETDMATNTAVYARFKAAAAELRLG
ncbi:MAG: 2-succinyl-5-enolpyruvyl-6-hydroxy-3-cyclohexene-1-carboxylic-acid synthase [Caldilineaceae bacterium]